MSEPLRPRVVGLVASIAALAALSVAVASVLAASNVPVRAADSAPAAERLAAGPYALSVTRFTVPGGERAEVLLTDGAGHPVAGKPVTGLLVYQGTAPGHEHHDILVSREIRPGLYVLDMREAVSGPWLLTVVVGQESRTAIAFVVP
jgi:hypothetical protein